MEIVLAGLSSEYDAVVTLASFSSEPLPLRRLMDVLLEFESRPFEREHGQHPSIGPRVGWSTKPRAH